MMVEVTARTIADVFLRSLMALRKLKKVQIIPVASYFPTCWRKKFFGYFFGFECGRQIDTSLCQMPLTRFCHLIARVSLCLQSCLRNKKYWSIFMLCFHYLLHSVLTCIFVTWVSEGIASATCGPDGTVEPKSTACVFLVINLDVISREAVGLGLLY